MVNLADGMARKDPLVELLVEKMCSYFIVCKKIAEAEGTLRENGLPSTVIWDARLRIAGLEARGKALEEICLDLIKIYERRG